MPHSNGIKSALIFSEKVLRVAIETVGAADITLSEKGACDPQVIALALLCRTIANFKGAMVLARENLIVESRVLSRCCYENLLWIAALRDRGTEFVNEMLNDEAANRKSLGEMTLKLTSRAGADMSSDGIATLRNLIKKSNQAFPNGKKMRADKTAFSGAVELAYSTYGRLSLDSVHPSITALGRHIHSGVQDGERTLSIDVVPPSNEKEHVESIFLGCEATLGVTVATNEILGGTTASDAIRAVYEEFPAAVAASSPT